MICHGGFDERDWEEGDFLFDIDRGGPDEEPKEKAWLPWYLNGWSRTFWKRDDGYKHFEAHLVRFQEHDIYGPYEETVYEEATVRYWAKRPVVAAREIVRRCNENGDQPSDFYGEDIDV